MCQDESETDEEYKLRRFIENTQLKDRDADIPAFEQIEFTHRERDILRFLVEKHLHHIIEYSNLYFDDSIDKLEVSLARCVNILRKLSKSSEKHWKKIKEFKLPPDGEPYEIQIELDDEEAKVLEEL